jgi:hypothetical protein
MKRKDKKEKIQQQIAEIDFAIETLLAKRENSLAWIEHDHINDAISELYRRKRNLNVRGKS